MRQDYIERADVDVDLLKEKAKQFVEDNLNDPTAMDYLMIESAMLIGALTITTRNVT